MAMQALSDRGFRAMGWVIPATAALGLHFAVAALMFLSTAGPSHRVVPPWLELELLVTEIPGTGTSMDTPAQPVASFNARAESGQDISGEPAPLEKASVYEMASGSSEGAIPIPKGAQEMSGIEHEDEQMKAVLLQRVAAAVSQQIRAAWKVPYSAAPDTRARISVELSRDGRIEAISLLSSNGDASFDNSIVRALERIGGFGAVALLPEALYLSEFRQVVLVFDAESRRRL